MLEAEGERFEYWARGRARRTRVGTWQGGDRVLVRIEREQLDADRARRVAWQHVVGEVTVEWAADVRAGGPADRASNRVRDALRRGSESLPGDDAALFRGLVIGDDADQPPAMLDRFRASGLSHLTAVSGQNVAFLLAAAGPLLRRLRAGPRWAATVVLVGVVRRAHPVRAVDPAGRGDGGPVGHGVRAGLRALRRGSWRWRSAACC